jgi:hypothetical protein
MHRAPRRAWCALAAAAGVVLVLPAATFASGTPAAPPGGEVTRPQATSAAKTLATAGAQRFTEIEIELAWLADPITFPHYLKAHAGTKQLQVEGYVPSNLVRDEALRVARAHCPVAVADEVKVVSGLTFPPTSAAPAHLQRAAEATLQRLFARQPSGFTVTCAADGRVTVTGVVGSIEDKLAVSRQLRYLPGCAAVANQLRVETPLPGGVPAPAVPAPAARTAPRTGAGRRPRRRSWT